MTDPSQVETQGQVVSAIRQADPRHAITAPAASQRRKSRGATVSPLCD